MCKNGFPFVTFIFTWVLYQSCEFFLSMNSNMNGLMDKNKQNDYFKHVQLDLCIDLSITDLTRQNK